MSRSARTLVAIMLWLLAGFMGANNIVAGSALSDWLWPLLFLVAGLILALYPEGEAHMEHAEAMALGAGASAAGHLPAPSAAGSHLPDPSHAPEPSPTPPPAPAPKPAAASAGQDDLTVIEGIGPKMQGALRAAGIDTYAKMAQTSEDDFRAAIQAQGMRLAPSIPTWAEQATYAAKGDFDGLSEFQNSLTAGRRS